jgi:cyclopropane fatty-acyl-phospholipid synthase-like methyltransferase
MSKEETMNLQIATLGSLGHSVQPESRVLDFGCGNGDLVQAYLTHGVDAYGCDLTFKEGPHAQKLDEAGKIRRLDPHTRKLPFEDNFFDFIMSSQVFEHVDDYPAAFAEISRILKPTGLSVHVFPSRYRPLEGHIKVPLASMIKDERWIRFWASCGFRPESSKDVSALEFAQRSADYLNNNTHYLTKAKIRSTAKQYFNQVEFCEGAFMRHTPRGEMLTRMRKVFPFLPYLYSAFQTRVLVLGRADSNHSS